MLGESAESCPYSSPTSPPIDCPWMPPAKHWHLGSDSRRPRQTTVSVSWFFLVLSWISVTLLVDPHGLIISCSLSSPLLFSLPLLILRLPLLSLFRRYRSPLLSFRPPNHPASQPASGLLSAVRYLAKEIRSLWRFRAMQ